MWGGREREKKKTINFADCGFDIKREQSWNKVQADVEVDPVVCSFINDSNNNRSSHETFLCINFVACPGPGQMLTSGVTWPTSMCT